MGTADPKQTPQNTSVQTSTFWLSTRWKCKWAKEVCRAFDLKRKRTLFGPWENKWALQVFLFWEFFSGTRPPINHFRAYVRSKICAFRVEQTICLLSVQKWLIFQILEWHKLETRRQSRCWSVEQLPLLSQPFVSSTRPSQQHPQQHRTFNEGHLDRQESELSWWIL